MFRPRLEYLIAVSIVFCLPLIANATTLTLLSGQKIDGQLIEQTELHITLDVNGSPMTYYMGEIASIDGKAVETPKEKAIEMSLAEAKSSPVAVPYYHDEQDSLVNFMNKRNPKASVPPAVIPSASVVPAKVQPIPVQALGGTSKSVVSTPDGGIIVVDNNKITKYDKDLNIVKNIDL